MADPSKFTYMYLVDFNSGNFSFNDSDSNPGNGLTPVGQNVTVKDELNDGGDDRHDTIGDVANDHFHLQDAGSFDGTYVFVSVATSGDGHGGLIALNEDTGLYYFFTNE